MSDKAENWEGSLDTYREILGGEDKITLKRLIKNLQEEKIGGQDFEDYDNGIELTIEKLNQFKKQIENDIFETEEGLRVLKKKPEYTKNPKRDIPFLEGYLKACKEILGEEK